MRRVASFVMRYNDSGCGDALPCNYAKFHHVPALAHSEIYFFCVPVMSSESSHSDSESSVDIEDIEDDLYAIEEAKLRNQERPTINDVQGLEQKLEEIKLRISGYEPDQIPWSEVLVLTSDKSTQEILDDADDDLKRERVFYDQAVEAIVSGLQKLRQEGKYLELQRILTLPGVPFERPDDYYAEMMKTDEHMKKIKGVLLKEKRQIDEAVERRKNRTNKKFAKQLQIKKKEQVFFHVLCYSRKTEKSRERCRIRCCKAMAKEPKKIWWR